MHGDLLVVFGAEPADGGRPALVLTGLGQLAPGGSCPSCDGGLVACSTVMAIAGRSPFVAVHRKGTGLGLAARTGSRRNRNGPRQSGRRGRGPVVDGLAVEAGPGFGGLLRWLRDEAGSRIADA